MINKQKIREEAIRWFLWLRENKVNETEMDIFKRWKSANIEHQRAYQEVESVWQMCDTIDDLPWPLPDELLYDTYDGSYPIPLPDQSSPSLTSLNTGNTLINIYEFKGPKINSVTEKQFYRKPIFGIAASLLLIAAAGILVLTQYNTNLPQSLYETVLAEEANYKLEDDTKISLGAQTRLTVEYTNSLRKINLLQGEAYFEVAKDSSRPFKVVTGTTTVEAIGTAFNINKRSNSIVVSVLEGVVKVGNNHSDSNKDSDFKVIEESIKPGHKITYDSSGNTWKLSDDDMIRAKSWRTGNLAYVNTPLDQVIEDLNRYSETMLVIGDDVIAEMVFTGTVHNDDVSDWLDGLITTFPIRLLKLDGRIVLLSPL